MTEAALDAGSAPAPADGAVIEAVTAPSSEPLPAQAPQKDVPEPKAAKETKPLSQTIRDASAKVKADTAAREAKAEPKDVKEPAKPVEKAPVKTEQPAQQKGPDGKFVSAKPAEEPKAQEPPKPTAFKDAPPRFDDAAKKDWEAVPESVRGAVHRTLTENEKGIQKYKAGAESWDQLREFDELARKTGTTVKDALSKYVQFDQLLRTPSNTITALERLVAHAGLKTHDGRQVTFRDIAAHYLGQKPEHVAARTESALQAALQKIDHLEKQIGGVAQSIEQQRASQTEAEVASFAKDHPRVDELAPDIEMLLSTGRATNLSEAYELAERLNPAPVQTASNTEPLIPAPSRPHTPAQPDPLKPAGQKSITGAPNGGSDPSRLKPAPTIREALKRAAARAG